MEAERSVTTGQQPGYSSSYYLSCLPEEMRANPNYQRVLSSALFQEIIAHPERLQEPDRLPRPEEIAAIERALGWGHDPIWQKNPYHKQLHTEQVRECVRRLAKMAGLSPERAALMDIGALIHDYDHSGHTYRQLVQTAQRNDLSNEEFAVIQADSYAGPVLSLKQRLELQGMGLATSFGQSNKAALPNAEFYRSYAPTTKEEKLLAFADIGRFMISTEAHVEGSLALIRETGKIPESFDAWIKGEQGFVNYIKMRFAEIELMLSAAGAEDIEYALTRLKLYFDDAATAGSARRSLLEERYRETISALA